MTNDLEQYVDGSESSVIDFDYREQSEAWWKVVLDDEDKLHNWLLRLHNTEKEAETRFNDFADSYCKSDTREDLIFRTIAEQERIHGIMIEKVLATRGVQIDPTKTFNPRYWAHMQPCIKGQETAAGVGYFAEDLSLQRMQVIIESDQTPEDLRKMFIPIHKDEGYHTKILAKLAGEYGIKEVVDCHTAGLQALGLEIKARNV